MIFPIAVAFVEMRRDHGSTPLRLGRAGNDALRVGAIERERREIAQQRMRKGQLFQAERAADPLCVAIARVVAQPHPVRL